MILSQSIIVNRSASDIFQYYADFSRHKEFISSLSSTEVVSPGAFGLGAQIVERGDILMGIGLSEMHSEVVAFEPNVRITCTSVGEGNRVEQDFLVEPIDAASCKVTYTAKVLPPSDSLMKSPLTVSPFTKAKMKRQLEKDIARFKSVLEGGYDKR
jgi:uncharacterized membrane protein